MVAYTYSYSSWQLIPIFQLKIREFCWNDFENNDGAKNQELFLNFDTISSIIGIK